MKQSKLQVRIYGEGAGVRTPPPWDDLQLSNTKYADMYSQPLT